STQFGGRDKETAGDLGWTLVGLGKGAVRLPKLRRAVRRAIKDALRHQGRGRLLAAFGDAVEGPTLTALLPQLAQADYAFERYKSRRGARNRAALTILPPPRAGSAPAWRTAVREAEAIASASAWARDLGNTPANDLGPAELAREVRAMTRGRRI